MWTPLAFFVILVAAASAEYGFKVGTEYKYEVTSKTLTSLQQVSQQYSGIQIRAHLTVTPVKEDELVAYITQPEKAQIHTTLLRGIEDEIPQNVVHYSPFSLSKEPFVIKLKEGIVDELIVSKDLPVWEVNVIRSIVSQLQIDTKGRRLIVSKSNTIPRDEENTAVYKIMEDTVEGECEVLYDITPLPKYILQRMPHLAPMHHLNQKENLIDVVKAKNFSNCEQRPGYHFGITRNTDWIPTTNKVGSFLSRSSVSRIILSGSLKSYTIQSSVTTNKIVLSPEIYNTQKGEVVSRVNLTLVSVQSKSNSQTLQVPQNPQTLKKLVYDFNSPFTTDAQTRESWEGRHEKNIITTTDTSDETTVYGSTRSKRYIDEKTLILSNEGWYQPKPKMSEAPDTPFLPYFIGYLGHSIQNSKETNVNQVVRKICEQIGQTLQDQTHISKEETLEKFTILTSIIRTMSAKQLEQLVQEIYVQEQEGTQEVSGTPRNAWLVLRDALAQAGTGPALTIIATLINQQKIKGEEAAQVVCTLTDSTRYPTTEYLNTFFELVKNPVVLSQQGLNFSVINSFTKLVRFSQVDLKTIHKRYPVHSFGYLTPQDDTTVTDVYIPYFGQQLEQAVSDGDSIKIQTYIMALGNIAHPKIIEVFESYLEGKKPMTEFQRTLIVTYLSKLAQLHPEIVRPILYKIYANTGEIYQVRVAAVYNLMKAKPTASMLQRMAQFTHEDPSNQVRSAVKSAIESAALLVSKTKTELRQNAQSAVNMLVPKVYGIHYSRINLTDYLVRGLHLGYLQTFQYTGSEDSLIPNSFFYKVVGDINSYKSTLLRISGMISSVQSLHQLILDTLVNEDDISNVDESGTGTETGPGAHSETIEKITIEKIKKLLNIELPVRKQVEGNVVFKFGTMQGLFSFDNHTIENLPHYLNKVFMILSKGKMCNYQKIFNDYELTLAFPTATGLPFVYTFNTPIYIGIKGKVQGKVEEIHTTSTGNRNQLPKNAHLTSNLEITFAKTKQGQISFVTPFDHQRYISGYKKQIQINVPVKGSLTIDIQKRHVELEVKPVDKHGDYKVFHYSTTPYTSVQDVTDFKPVIQGSNTKVLKNKPLKEVNEVLGGKYLGMVFRLQGQTEKRNVDLKKLIYDTIKRHDIISGVLYPMCENSLGNTKVDLYYDTKASTAQTIKVSATYRQIRSKEHGQGETNTGKVFVPQTNDQSRIDEFYKQASAGVKGGIVKVLDLGLKVQGQIPIQYVGTVAFARSPVAAPTKVLAYLHKTVSGGENYEVCFDGTVKDTYVSIVDYEKAIHTQPQSEIMAHLKFGKQCETGTKLSLTGKLERSQERKQFLETLPQVQQCKNEMQQGNKMLTNCRNATFQAGLMDKYRLTLNYDGITEKVKNMTYQVYSVLRHIGYPYVTENLSGNEVSGTTGKKVELDVNFSPDLKTASVYISTPVGLSQFRDVPVNKYIRTVTVVHPVLDVVQRFAWSSFQQQYKAYCTIDKVQAKTFDNQTYPVHLVNAWHVLSVSIPKSNSENNNDNFKEFAILARENPSGKKEVQFTFDYSQGPVVYITSSTQGKSSGSIYVNGQQVQFDESGIYVHKNVKGNVVFQAYALPTGELKVAAIKYGFDVIYDPNRIQISLNQDYRNRVGGLCGVYDGEHFDFVTPKRYILKNPEEFVATWTLTNEGRIGELKQQAEQHSLYKKIVIPTDVVGGEGLHYGKYHEDEDYESNSTRDRQGTGCTTKRIMVIERDNKHCFSVHPQTACRAGCHVEKTKTMTTDFVCVNKTQTSSHWAQMVAKGAQPSLKNKGNTQKIQFEVPEMCTE